MRDNSWKTKAIVFVAFIISILGGIVAAIAVPEAYAIWKGVVGFGLGAVLFLLLTVLFVKILHIGRD